MIRQFEGEHAGAHLPALINGTAGPELTGVLQEHIDTCDACREAEVDWRALATSTRAAAAALPPASRGLIDRVFLRIDAGSSGAEQKTKQSWGERLAGLLSRRRLVMTPLGGVMVAAVLCGIALVVLAGANAGSLYDVFRPKQLAIVPVSMTEIQDLPDLSQYGALTVSQVPEPMLVAGAVEASAAAGMHVLQPASLPAAVSSDTVKYGVLSGSSASFTFSADKARAAAQAQGKEPAQAPANIDGSTLQVSTGAAVIAVYGGDTGAVSDLPAPAGLPLKGIPSLVVGQTTVPTVTASGASAGEIERYLLSQPGIPPRLAGAIRALGTPGSSWPIPVPIELASSHSVKVQGVKGLAVGDPTGIGAGILWQKDGTIYAVAGTLTEGELLSIANSLR